MLQTASPPFYDLCELLRRLVILYVHFHVAVAKMDLGLGMFIIISCHISSFGLSLLACKQYT